MEYVIALIGLAAVIYFMEKKLTKNKRQQTPGPNIDIDGRRPGAHRHDT